MNNKKTYIIAEMACSHEGDIDLAFKIIDGAAEASADAVQLQIWSLANMMAPQRPEHELLKKVELTRNEWSDIVTYTRNNYPRMHVYVCVYEHQSIDFIESLNIDGYKLNSSDLSNPYVLEKVSLTGKPINLSVGASTIGEIQSAIEKIRASAESEITLMYGYQSFPTRPDDVHLNYMLKLKELFELPIGYQDHCDAETESAFWLPAAAIGMGVDVLEKHITHDRSFKGIDHESALNHDEFVRFVEMVRILESSKGSSVPRPFSDDEIKYREFQKKSVVAACDLARGTMIREKDLLFMRAESLGMQPDKVSKLVGKNTIRPITAYSIIIEDDVS